jgi:hypothetical protein
MRTIDKIEIHYPDNYHMWGIQIETYDKVLYKWFNIACERVLSKYRGFHQSGSFDEDGYSYWELWTEQTEDSMLKILDEVAEEIKKKE